MKRHFEERIQELVTDSSDGADLLSMSMRAATLGAGKRMRPLLLMVIARDLGCASPALVDVACAVELVHASSLVLDDMPCMDDARLRRGAPAIHVTFGQDVAILASISLLSRAFHILARAEDLAPQVRTSLVTALAAAVGTQGLAKGQFQDLHGGVARSVDDIALTNELKTGALLGATVDMAAIICQADAGVAQSLRAFAFAAGQAFQIRDDLKDLPGNDSAVTGKDVGLDAGKATLLTTLGVDEAQRRLQLHLQEAERHLDDAVGAQQGTRRLLGSFFAGSKPLPGPAREPRMAAHATGAAALGY
ncbi:polyprenyl synthetase family protein [Janthinobacterium sp.]|uniref:polyprenyl synthetase family protein n=1 Tax=Janthinobacterium sp. TaxID=1871054 RepID=UPI00289FB85D|nr:polyprenyl synthetase family protein [Janthinobacterium sp.]